MSTIDISDEIRALVKEKLAAKVSPLILSKTFNILTKIQLFLLFGQFVVLFSQKFDRGCVFLTILP